jgi:hypothetical protein
MGKLHLSSKTIDLHFFVEHAAWLVEFRALALYSAQGCATKDRMPPPVTAETS